MVTTPTPTDTLTIATPDCASVRVGAEQVLRFSPPLAPFLQFRRYALVDTAEAAPFLWLQSLEEPALALVVAPYEAVCAEPAPDVPEETRRALGLGPDEMPEPFVIVCLGADHTTSTMNLLAPLFVCRRTGRARQVILDGDVGLAQTPLPVAR